MEVEIEESDTLFQDQVDVPRHHVCVVSEVERLCSVVVVDAKSDKVVLERFVFPKCLVRNLKLRRLDEVASWSNDHLPLQNQVGVIPKPIKELLVVLLLVEVLEDIHNPLLWLESGVYVV